jgi:hypothetical protein
MPARTHTHARTKGPSSPNAPPAATSATSSWTSGSRRRTRSSGARSTRATARCSRTATTAASSRSRWVGAGGAEVAGAEMVRRERWGAGRAWWRCRAACRHSEGCRRRCAALLEAPAPGGMLLEVSGCRCRAAGIPKPQLALGIAPASRCCRAQPAGRPPHLPAAAAVQACEYRGLDRAWDYSQQHMDDIRVKTVHQICAGRLPDPQP